MKRKDHYRITWSPVKTSIFHTQSLDWSKEFEGGDRAKLTSRTRRKLKSVAWPTERRRSWKQRVISRWLNPDRPQKESAAKLPENSFLPMETGERRKTLRLLAVDWLAVVWGWVASLAVTLVALALAAFYVAFTPGSVYYLSTYLFLNKVISPLLGGVLAGARTKQSSLTTGFWVGLGYGFIVLVFRLYAGLFSSFWTEAITGMLASIFAGIVGAVLGITMTGSRTIRENRQSLAVD